MEGFFFWEALFLTLAIWLAVTMLLRGVINWWGLWLPTWNERSSGLCFTKCVSLW